MSELPKERYGGTIESRNFKLKRTIGTYTEYSFVDKRTCIKIGFDFVNVGLSLGRGDVIQFKVDLEESSYGATIGSVYQHDVEEEILNACRHIENQGELPQADFVKDEL